MMMFVFYRYRILFLLVWLLPAGLKAQVADSARVRELEEVKVSGIRRPSLSRSTAPLQVMSGKDVERLGLQDMSDAVRRFSGVTVKDYGGIGGLKTVSIRSLGAQHTAVSYDGVTISDCQSGQVDISRFSLDNVEMLSLFIGQSDDIFQTARMLASAGALAIRTTQPVFSDRNYEAQLQVRTGSFGLVNPSVRYARKINNSFTTSLHADWLRADGQYPYLLKNGQVTTHEKRKNSDIRSLRAELNVYADFNHGGKMSLKAYYFDSERGLPGSVVLYNSYTKERLWDRNFFTQLRYENNFNKFLALQLQVKYNYSWNRYVDINNKYEGGRQEDRHKQQEYYGSGTLMYTPSAAFSFSLASDMAVNKLDNNFMDCPFPKRYTSLTALSAQYKNGFMTATASLLGTYLTEKVEEGEQPEDRKKLSPAVSVSFRPWASENLYLRLLYKNIFRVPTFNDLYYLRIGNRDLKPESTTQYNVGVTWTGTPFSWTDNLNISVDGYYNRVRDKIVAIPTMFIWKMMNMGEVEIKGLDVNVVTGIGLSQRVALLLNGTYSFQQAVDVTDRTAKNYRHQIPYTPEHSGSGSVAVEMPWVNVAYTLTGSGDRYALPQNIKGNRIEGYVEQSISVNREFDVWRCRLRLQGEVVNLADKQYDVIHYYPMPGRSYRFSVSLRTGR